MAKPNQTVPATNLVAGSEVIATTIPKPGPWGFPADAIIAMPENAARYPQRQGGWSTVALTVTLPLLCAAGAVAIKGSLYARIGADGGNRVTFEIALPSKGITLTEDLRDAFKMTANEAVIAYGGKRAAFAAALKRLTAPVVPKTATKGASVGSGAISWSPDDDDMPDGASGEPAAAPAS